MKKILSSFSLFIAGLLIAGYAYAGTYNIDTTHSTLGFEVSHLVVGVTKGEFGDYQGIIVYDPDNVEGTKIDVIIQSTSIDTKLADRDNHLRNADFFDVENHPTLTFKSKKVVQEGSKVVIVGDLTMRGVTKEIEIPAKISGPIQSPFGSTVIGIAGETTVNRQDYGISWNKSLDQGGYVVGNEVLIKVNVEAHKR